MLLIRVLFNFYRNFKKIFRDLNSNSMLPLEVNNDSIYYTICGVTDLTKHGYFLYTRTVPTHENIKAAGALLNKGNVQQITVNGYEDDDVYITEANKLSVIGGGLIASIPGTRTNYPEFALSCEYACEKIQEYSEKQMSIEEVIVFIATLITCGHGMGYPPALANLLYKQYFFELWLSPLYNDPEVIIALKILKERQPDKRLWKFLSKFNSVDHKFEHLELFF